MADHARRVALWVAALIVIAPLIATAQTWCPKPSAAAAREILFQSTEALRPAVDKIVGGRRYLLIRKPSGENIRDEAAYQRTYVDTVIQTHSDPRRGEPQYEEELRTVASQAAIEDFENAIAGNVGKAEDGQTVEMVYFYSNAPRFREDVDIPGVEHGAVMEGWAGEFDALFKSGDKPARLPELLRKWRIEHIVVDDVEIDPLLLNRLPKATTIIKLPRDAEAMEPLISLAQGRIGDDRAVIFALPTTIAQGLQWGMTQHRAEQFAHHGARIKSTLLRQGVRMIDLTGKSPAEVEGELISLRSSGLKLAVIGEAANGGAGFRIPGQAAPVEVSGSVAKALNGALLLYCNSSAAQSNGVSVVGRVYSAQSQNFILAMFGADDGGVPEHASNQPSGPDGWPSPWPAPTTLNLAATWVMQMNDPTSNWMLDLATLADGKLVVGEFNYVAPPPPSPPPPPPPLELPPWIGLALVGAVGGAAKEFFRWRTLVLRARASKFLRPEYLATSAGFIVLAGFVGALFGSLFQELAGLVVAFTAGVGLEEIIARGSRLEIWNPQGVDLNDQADEEPSPQEFLKR
ncbi:hypothetical protein [Brevundimonas nasdae]|uniref:CHASE2 domain-containing protein n=1 Tax=Brevundimonas nasdae TaxID=172043 RepID=A0ABX8TLI9_9CAUL|nr:hypothetical protein [Brevundimonas nasdae]QYC11514.1 hypothetical protein KWG56_05930 [Brevundimonas nasdae]QYC14302.1 hypothetical protein KWG63_01265 [Brevundimonas nasdae]